MKTKLFYLLSFFICCTYNAEASGENEKMNPLWGSKAQLVFGSSYNYHTGLNQSLDQHGYAILNKNQIITEFDGGVFFRNLFLGGTAHVFYNNSIIADQKGTRLQGGHGTTQFGWVFSRRNGQILYASSGFGFGGAHLDINSLNLADNSIKGSILYIPFDFSLNIDFPGNSPSIFGIIWGVSFVYNYKRIVSGWNFDNNTVHEFSLPNNHSFSVKVKFGLGMHSY